MIPPLKELASMPACYSCRFCGGEHVFPVKFPDKKNFEQSMIVARVLRCEVKPERGMYWRKDLFWRDTAPKAVKV
jgi:hypothetical protein